MKVSPTPAAVLALITLSLPACHEHDEQPHQEHHKLVAVTPYAGRQTRDESIRAVPDEKFTEYVSGPMTVRPLADGAVLVTYALTQKGTFKGKPIPPKAHAAAVWVKKDGKWKEAYYQETAADGP